METGNFEEGGRLVGLPEIMTRSGLSKSYFYNYRSRGTLGLPLEKIDGTLQCHEADFSAWLEKRQFLYAARIHELPGELVLILGDAAGDPDISPQKYPEVFVFIPSLLNDRLTALVKTMKLDQRIPLEEFPECFKLATEEIERSIHDEFPAAAAAALSSIFQDQVLKAHSLMHQHVVSEHRAYFREYIRVVAISLQRCQLRTLEEKMLDLDQSIDEAVWTYAGYSAWERRAISREVLQVSVPLPQGDREAEEVLRQVGVILERHLGPVLRGGEA